MKNLFDSIKEKASRVLIRHKSVAKRNRRGSDLNSAGSVAILYCDTDENHFKQIRRLVRELREEFRIRQVLAMGCVDRPEKEVPIYQAHKLEMDYFTKDDLSWNLSPSNHLQHFLQVEFDILIDLADTDSVALEFLLHQSLAKMKVGPKGSAREGHYDLIIHLSGSNESEARSREVVSLLSKLTIR